MDKVNLRQPVSPLKPPTSSLERTTIGGNNSFKDIFQRELEQGKLKFSRHAMQRLETRKIEFSPQDLEKLEGAIEKAAQKGARDSLVLIDDLALIVSVTNRTVITALDGESRKENIFTNIDSAVIV